MSIFNKITRQYDIKLGVIYYIVIYKLLINNSNLSKNFVSSDHGLKIKINFTYMGSMHGSRN